MRNIVGIKDGYKVPAGQRKGMVEVSRLGIHALLPGDIGASQFLSHPGKFRTVSVI